MFNRENYFGFRVVCILILSLTFTSVHAQNIDFGWVYIENVETGLVLDVKRNVMANGTQVWPFKINHGKAQIFRFLHSGIPEKFGNNARYINAYDDNGARSDFYVSVKTKTPVVKPKPPKAPSSSRGNNTVFEAPLEVMDMGRPKSTRDIASNYVFSIEAKGELDTSPLSGIKDAALGAATPPKQIWKILPVENEPGVYYIQNAQFSKKMVMEPLDFDSGGTLVLGVFTGSNLQKWRIIKTRATAPTDLTLTNFEWKETYVQDPWYKPWKWHFVQKIKGKLAWNNDSALNVSKLIIGIDDGSRDYKTIRIDPNKTSYDFNIESNSELKTKEHCFTLNAYSIWQAQNYSGSNEECQKPEFEVETSSTTTPVTRISKLLIKNCHNDRETVRLWTYDLTTNNGAWKDHGTLSNQWQGSSCGSGTPKEIEISDNHVYLLAAIDCGNLPPNQTNGSCHRLTSAQIQGGLNGASLSFTIN